MKITIFGSGYVGLVTAACLSEIGHEIIVVDIDEEKVLNLEKGNIGIFEPGLIPMVKRNQKNGRLKFTSNKNFGIHQSKSIFICVGTPENQDGSANLNQVFQVVDSIASGINQDKNIIIKSTIPPGTSKEIQLLFKKKLKNKAYNAEILSNPEFLREGSAIRDFMKPDRIIVGMDSDKRKLFYKIYNFLKQDKLVFMDLISAELTKYASNAMLATKISFINEIANISDLLNGNIDLIKEGLGRDSRIGFSFINPGSGYGGSCFPKDVKALISVSKDLGYKAKQLKATDEVNKKQKVVMFNKISKHFKDDLNGLKFALWGLTFKPDTDDVRESPSIDVVKKLLNSGASVSAYDPKGNGEFKKAIKTSSALQIVDKKEDCLEGADALILMTEWDEFRIKSTTELRNNLNKLIIFDGRNCLDTNSLDLKGFKYYGVGKSYNES
jgi:UDPglucose 6-dehydrogenase